MPHPIGGDTIQKDSSLDGIKGKIWITTLFHLPAGPKQFLFCDALLQCNPALETAYY